ncbi:unnamed protein product [Amoebophrya sp. A25]|nr:unnamed protein product [Amoebophrya sp. A25]|eukprot:GSA25T00006308001.1
MSPYPHVTVDMLLARDDLWICCTWWCPCATFSIRVIIESLLQMRLARQRKDAPVPTSSSGESSVVGPPQTAYEIALEQIQKPFMKPRKLIWLSNLGDKGLQPDRDPGDRVNLGLVEPWWTKLPKSWHESQKSEEQKKEEAEDAKRFQREEFQATGGQPQLRMTKYVGEKFASRVRRYYKPGSKLDHIVIRVVKGECIDLTLHKRKYWKNPDLDFVKHPRVLSVRAALRDIFFIQPNADALMRVGNLIITMNNWTLADSTRPVELEFVRVAPEWLAEHPRRKYHVLRKVKQQLRHKTKEEIFDAVQKTVGNTDWKNPVLGQLEGAIDYDSYLKDPQEQKDFFPLDARCDFARDVPSGNALDRGPQHSFRDLHQEARDRRQAREEYFGRAAAPTPSPSKRQRRKRRRRASTQIEPEEDPEIELVVEVKDGKPVELID